jgi:hypothetical protein
MQPLDHQENSKMTGSFFEFLYQLVLSQSVHSREVLNTFFLDKSNNFIPMQSTHHKLVEVKYRIMQEANGFVHPVMKETITKYEQP